MLQRREYAGDVTINGEVVAEATFEAIVDRKAFDIVNRSLGQTAPWRSLPDSGLLTGLLVCGVCGAKMKRGRGESSNRQYGCLAHEWTWGGRLYLSVAADRDVVQAVRAKARQMRDEGSTNTWLYAQAGAIEHEIAQVRRRHEAGELTRASMETVIQHLRSRLVEERSGPSARSSEGDEPDVWVKWDLESQRRWLTQIVSQIVVARTTRAAHGPTVDSGRVTIHYRDGGVETLARSAVTLSDVGRRAGCDRETAGRALNGTGKMTPETRARVRAAAEKLGYDLSRLKNGDHWSAEGPRHHNDPRLAGIEEA
jgi:hypothetical protein